MCSTCYYFINLPKTSLSVLKTCFVLLLTFSVSTLHLQQLNHQGRILNAVELKKEWNSADVMEYLMGCFAQKLPPTTK